MHGLGTAVRDVEIAGLTADSRAVRPGYLFAALPGSRLDGRDFIRDAISRGAAAILAPTGTSVPAETSVPLVTHPDPRREFAHMAARFFGHQPPVIAAVTGTNGKSSVVGFARQIWTKLDEKAASLGTLGLDAPDMATAPGLTTPDPVSLHQQLAALADAGVTHLALEASSHGLAQSRLDGVRLRAAAFTNFSRDHLDYHATPDDYFRAKARLFKELLPAGCVAVLNADVPEYGALRDICRAGGHEILSYGYAGADIRLDDATPLRDGLRLCLVVRGRSYETHLPLLGAFQVDNALAALGLVVACGGEPDAAVSALPRLAGIHGRMEVVARHPNGARICIDYAHTPAALDAALGAIRPHVRGDLVAVFGAGGDRDRGKRPLMGAAAARHADPISVTDDNPRVEDPALIRKQILKGCSTAREIGDRTQAIGTAITELAPDDVLVIAGKGHEQSQIVGQDVVPFDDGEVARTTVGRLAARVAPERSERTGHG